MYSLNRKGKSTSQISMKSSNQDSDSPINTSSIHYDSHGTTIYAELYKDSTKQGKKTSNFKKLIFYKVIDFCISINDIFLVNQYHLIPRIRSLVLSVKLRDTLYVHMYELQLL